MIFGFVSVLFVLFCVYFSFCSCLFVCLFVCFVFVRFWRLVGFVLNGCAIIQQMICSDGFIA